MRAAPSDCYAERAAAHGITGLRVLDRSEAGEWSRHFEEKESSVPAAPARLGPAGISGSTLKWQRPALDPSLAGLVVCEGETSLGNSF